MGFFGGDNEPDNRANDLIEQQMLDNEIEIENKRRSLTQTRLDVVKSQGAQQWMTPPMGTGQQPVGNRPGFGGKPNIMTDQVNKLRQANIDSIGKPVIGKQ